MKNHFLTLGILASVLVACTETQPTADKGNTTDVFTKVYSQEKLPSQTFTIDNSKDNVLTGKSGTLLNIPKNAFADASGKPVTGKVEIELKEAIQPLDIVLGNMTTTFNGQPLQTGGMIYLNARANNTDLTIQSGKSIGVTIPADSALAEMSLFEGVQENGTIAWKNPVPLPEPPPVKKPMPKRKPQTNVVMILGQVSPLGDTIMKHSKNTIAKATKIIQANGGLQITQDSFLTIDDKVVELVMASPPIVRRDSATEARMRNKLDRMETNDYADVTKKVNYIFSMKQLGWANIDRLYSDPRTQAVEFITTVENKTEFEMVYVTLLTSNMYLPGYVKGDGTYGFSHGDAEQQRLPVGAEATLLATAYKDGHPYFAMQKVTLEPVQTVSLKLEPTTQEQMTEELIAGL